MNDDVNFKPVESLENYNISKIHPLKELIQLAINLVFISVTAFFLLGFASDYLVKEHHQKVEKLLSKYTKKIISAENIKLLKTDSIEHKKVKKVFDKVILAMGLIDRGYNIGLAKSKEVNAFAYPGGEVVVYRGLLKKIKTENELAFVIGHEIGHLENKDSIKGVSRGLIVLFASAFLLGDDSFLTDYFSNFIKYSTSEYSQDQEVKADQYGLKALDSTYRHVTGAVEFMKVLAAEEFIIQKFLIMKSHPISKKRIKLLNQLIEDQKYKIGKAIAW